MPSLDSKTRGLRRAAGMAILLALSLSACSSEPSQESVDEAVAESLEESFEGETGDQACDDIWTEGGVLPENYDACTSDDGTIELAVSFEDCADGGSIVVYIPASDQTAEFYAAPGETIAKGETGDASAACTG